MGRAIKRSVFYYGWIMAIIMGVMFFVSDGSLDVVAATSNPLMQADLNMTGTEVGAGFAAFLLMYGVGASLAGWLIAKVGLRLTQGIGGFFLLLGGLVMAFVVSEPLLYTVVFATMGAFSICVGQVSVQTAISVWFVRRRGIAMAAAMTIGGLGGFVAPLIANFLITAFGGSWRAAWFYFIAVGILVMVLAALVVRNEPADLGLEPDGCALGKSNPEAKMRIKSSRVYKNEHSIALKSCWRLPAFWLILMVGLGGFFSFTLAVGTTSLHFTQLGFDPLVIVGGLSAMGFASLIAKFAWGVIADKFEPIRLIAIASTIATVGILIGSVATEPFMVLVYYAVVGFTYGCVATNFPTSVANYFGVGEYSKILGTLMFFIGGICAIVPIIGGAFFDAIGSYAPIFYISASVVAVCALCGFVLRLPTQATELQKNRR